MCLFKKSETKPVLDLLTIGRGDYLQALGIPALAPDDPLDGTLSVTTKAELDRIAPGLALPADLYIADIADCEDYALRAQGLASFDYHVSSIRLCLGDTPLGYHGFLIALDTDNNVWLLEPNAAFDYAGRWFKPGQNGYQPKKVLV